MEFVIEGTTLTDCIHAEMAEEIIVPEGVTCIGTNAFYECCYADRIVLPEGVNRLDSWAFGGVGMGLTEVVLPDSITEIAEDAFWDCNTLVSVRIPAGVRKLPPGVLRCCLDLQEILVSEQNPVYESVDGVLFTAGRTELFCYPQRRRGSEYTVPDGVKSIGDYAFYESTRLKRIILPESVRKIGSHAFQFCVNLREVNIPEAVKRLKESAFARCDELSEDSLRQIQQKIRK